MDLKGDQGVCYEKQGGLVAAAGSGAACPAGGGGGGAGGGLGGGGGRGGVHSGGTQPGGRQGDSAAAEENTAVESKGCEYVAEGGNTTGGGGGGGGSLGGVGEAAVGGKLPTPRTGRGGGGTACPMEAAWSAGMKAGGGGGTGVGSLAERVAQLLKQAPAPGEAAPEWGTAMKSTTAELNALIDGVRQSEGQTYQNKGGKGKDGGKARTGRQHKKRQH